MYNVCMSDQLVTTNQITIEQAGELAQSHIRSNIIELAFERLAPNTIKSRKQAAGLWRSFMYNIGVNSLDMNFEEDPAAWAGVGASVIEVFQRWMLQSGFAINTVNQRVSAIRWYCQLAARAGFISGDALAMINSVRLIRHSEGMKIDEKRPVSRVGRKKSSSVQMSQYHVSRTKAMPATDPRSIRDRLLMCLMLDQAMRVGEVVILEVENFDLEESTVRFFRPKTGETHTHALTESTLLALGEYLALPNAPKSGRLLKATTKGGNLAGDDWKFQYISESAIDKIIRKYGESIGLPGLSAHDFRHSAATRAARGGTDLRALMSFGGWKSASTVERYLDKQKVHNEGVKGVD